MPSPPHLDRRPVLTALLTSAASQGRRSEGHGLKANAVGFTGALIIGLASTAPAYSLAAVIGLVVLMVGVQAPAVFLVCRTSFGTDCRHTLGRGA
ncbi:MAG: hypothetical protein ACREVE_12025 [Gammaproteobacteria bacterium]